MKVKVGDKIYSSEDQPVMVILTEQDKFNIAHMRPEDMKYAEFPSNTKWLPEEMIEWMEEIEP